MIVCSSCKNESADDALFCGFCGNKLQSAGVKQTLFGIAGIAREDLKAAAKPASPAKATPAPADTPATAPGPAAATQPLSASGKPASSPSPLLDPTRKPSSSSAAALAAALQAKKAAKQEGFAEAPKSSKPSIPRLGGTTSPPVAAAPVPQSLDLSDLAAPSVREAPATLQDMPAAGAGTPADDVAPTFQMPVLDEEEERITIPESVQLAEDVKAAAAASPLADANTDDLDAVGPTLIQPKYEQRATPAQPQAKQEPARATPAPSPAPAAAAPKPASAPVVEASPSQPAPVLDKSDEQEFFGSTLSRAYLTPARKGDPVEDADMRKANAQSYLALLAGIIILGAIVAAFAYLMIVGGQ